MYERDRNASGIIGNYQAVKQLKFKFVGLDYYVGGDQVISYAKDGIQIDISLPVMDARSAEL